MTLPRYRRTTAFVLAILWACSCSGSPPDAHEEGCDPSVGGGGAADPPCHPAMQQAVEDAAVPKVAVGMLAGHVLAGGLGHGGDLREDRMLTAGFNITAAASAGGIVGGGGGGAAQVPVPFLRSATDVIDDVRSQLRDEKRINLDRRMKVEAYMRRLRDEEMRKKKEEVVRKKLVEMKRKKALEMTLKARLETRVKKEEEDYRKFVVRSLWKGSCYTSMSTAYAVGRAIAPNRPICTGPGLRYSIQPPLPDGLAFNTTTGIIVGAPRRVRAAVPHVVTVTNGHGVATCELMVGVAAGAAIAASGAAVARAAVCAHGGEASGPYQGAIRCDGSLDLSAIGRAAGGGMAGRAAIAAARLETAAMGMLSKTIPASVKAAAAAAAAAAREAANDTRDMCSALRHAIKQPCAASAVIAVVASTGEPGGLAAAASRAARLGANASAVTCAAAMAAKQETCTMKAQAAAEAWAEVAMPDGGPFLGSALKEAACCLQGLPAKFPEGLACLQHFERRLGRCKGPAKAANASSAKAEHLAASVKAEADEIMKTIEAAAKKAVEAGKKPDTNLADYLDPECRKTKPAWECVAEAAKKAADDAKTKKSGKETCLMCTVSTTTGSDSILPSCDLRDDVTVGDVVRIGGDATYEVCAPITGVNLKLNTTVKGSSNTGLTVCVQPDRPPPDQSTCRRTEEKPVSLTEGVPLCGCVDVLRDSVLVRTRCDMRAEIADGETIRITCGGGSGGATPAPPGLGFESAVTSPRDSATLTLTDAFTGESAQCCKADKVAARNADPSTCTALPGTVSLLRGSPIMRTSVDLRSELSDGDSLRVEGEEFVAGNPWDMTMLTLSRPWPLPTAGEARACKVVQAARGSALSCCMTTVQGSDRVWTACDLRPELKVGDTIKYDVVGPVDGFSFGINRKWTLPPVAHLKARKCLKRLDGGTPMCGTAEVFQGSRVVKTSCDLTSELSPSDTLKIGDEEFQVIDPMDDCTLTLNRPYPDETASGLKMVRLPLSEKQRILEELAKKKMACLSIYCLAKIEEQERGIAFSLPRALTVLNPEQWKAEQKSRDEQARGEGESDDVSMSSTVGHPDGAAVDGAEADPAAAAAARAAQMQMVMGHVNRTKAAVRAAEAALVAAGNPAALRVARDRLAAAKVAAMAAKTAAAAIANGDRGASSASAAGAVFVNGAQAAKNAENDAKQAKMGAATAYMALQNALGSGSASRAREARAAYGKAAASSAAAQADLAVTNSRVALAAAKESGDLAIVNNAQAMLAAATARSKAVAARNAANELLGAASGGSASTELRAAQDRAATAAAAAQAAAAAEAQAADYRGAAARRTGDPIKIKSAEEAKKQAVLKNKASEATMKAATAKQSYVEALGAPESDEKPVKLKTAALNSDVADQKADDAETAASEANKPLTDNEINEWRGADPDKKDEPDLSSTTIDQNGEIHAPVASGKGSGGGSGPGQPGGPGGPG
eukprot:g3495.t1